MPAHIVKNFDDKNQKKEEEIKQEMEAVLANALRNKEVSRNSKEGTVKERTQFYAGHERLDLRGNCVQRVRELQEENDHLQREISAKEKQVADSNDPLIILADIEHRKIIIARNTGEILKIYLKNEERIKRVKHLETANNGIQNEMMQIQGRFIATHSMEEKTQFASEFFVLKSEIENNLKEIHDLTKN